jgi:outer membrane beta-barrel protein
MLLASGQRAFAQVDGMDLSDEPKKDEPKKSDEPARTPAKTTPDKGDDPTAEKKDEGPAVERDVTQDDRVKSVQRKLYLKRGRFELAPSFLININDAYYTKLGGAIRAAIYPADTLAISVRFSLMQTLATDDVRTARRNLSSRIFFSVPIWTAMADAEWSPLYGKVAIFNSILHFDGYLLGGAGVVYTETSAATNDAARAGVKPAFDLGLGLRFVTTDWLAVNVSVINTSYTDLPTGSAKASLQNMMTVNVGVSIFFPLKSTFREAE